MTTADELLQTVKLAARCEEANLSTSRKRKRHSTSFTQSLERRFLSRIKSGVRPTRLGISARKARRSSVLAEVYLQEFTTLPTPRAALRTD
jgi:hypothetical protein